MTVCKKTNRHIRKRNGTKVLYVLFLLGLFSCAQDASNTRDTSLSLADLKFPDPQRIFIKQNRVDTTFTFHPQEGRPELVSYQTYDEKGRVLVESHHAAVVRYYYDKMGMVIKRETRTSDGGLREDSASYQFDNDSLILRKKWNDGDVEEKFFFDDSGKAVQSIELHDKIRTRTTVYAYDGDLLRKVQHYSHHKNHKDGLVEFEYYYTDNGVLDSGTVSTDYGHHQGWGYDSVGLINAEWWSSGKSDTRFVHVRKKSP